MAEISAALVKQLRDATNVSMMECKRALDEAGGDMKKATVLLRERGMAVAAKKTARAANQGLIAAHVTPDGTAGALIEVNCETDFVARNPTFVAFVKDLAGRAAATDAAIADPVRNEVIAKVLEIGENIVVRRNARFTLQGVGRLATYIHLGGKVGVLIEVGCGKAETAAAPAFHELVKDLTLHIAACSPRYLAPGDVAADEVAGEREIYAKQVHDKPPQIVEKIVAGKLKKYFAEVCLVEQEFVREPKVPVRTLLDQKGKELGDALSIRRFVRYQLGE